MTERKIAWDVALVTGSQPTEKGVVTITRRDRLGWRAVFTQKGNCHARKFGTARQSIYETVNLLTQNLQEQMAPGEIERLLKLARDEDCGVTNSQLTSLPSSNLTGLSANVTMIHQIYGLFRDRTPMPPLFCESKRRWQQLAVNMNARYHLWDADEVDTLVKNHYGFIWEAYTQCRYPVMRADIGRVCILHRYGGMYSDLDVIPNRFEYKQVPFSVGHAPHRNPSRKGRFLEMEVIIAKANHPMLIPWLVYMQEQIKSKPYRFGFWGNARMRYIWNTTGPAAMKRFFRLPANKKWVDGMPLLQLNGFWEFDDLTASDKDKFDCLTRVSNTYFTKENSVKAHVSETDVPLPYRSVPRRCTNAKLRPRVPALSQPERPAPDPPTRKRWRRFQKGCQPQEKRKQRRVEDQGLASPSASGSQPTFSGSQPTVSGSQPTVSGSQPTVSTAPCAQDVDKMKEDLQQAIMERDKANEENLFCGPMLKKFLLHTIAVKELPYCRDFYESLPWDLKTLVDCMSEVTGSQPTRAS